MLCRFFFFGWFGGEVIRNYYNDAHRITALSRYNSMIDGPACKLINELKWLFITLRNMQCNEMCTWSTHRQFTLIKSYGVFFSEWCRGDSNMATTRRQLWQRIITFDDEEAENNRELKLIRVKFHTQAILWIWIYSSIIFVVFISISLFISDVTFFIRLITLHQI